MYPKANLFLSTSSVPVYWGHFSIVEAEIICLSDLLSLDIPWKYAIDLAGSEMVLLTNKEMVDFLSADDSSDIFVESFPLPDMIRVRNQFQLNPDVAFNPDSVKSKSTFIRSKFSLPVTQFYFSGKNVDQQGQKKKFHSLQPDYLQRNEIIPAAKRFCGVSPLSSCICTIPSVE